jgi:hypothetical protein
VPPTGQKNLARPPRRLIMPESTFLKALLSPSAAKRAYMFKRCFFRQNQSSSIPPRSQRGVTYFKTQSLPVITTFSRSYFSGKRPDGGDFLFLSETRTWCGETKPTFFRAFFSLSAATREACRWSSRRSASSSSLMSASCNFMLSASL